MENVQRITDAYGHRLGQVLNSWASEQNSLRADLNATEGERIDRAIAAHEQHAQEYAEIIAERNAAYEAKEAEVKGALFGTPDSSSLSAAYTQALLDARHQDDEGLVDVAEMAAHTGNEMLGRAALAAAARRGNPGLAISYINSDDDVRTLIRELGSIPNSDERAKSAESSLPLPKLEDLEPATETRQAAFQAEQVERARRSRLR
jgi:hypothetical protein